MNTIDQPHNIPITQYYFDTFIVGSHHSVPHLIADLQSRRSIAMFDMANKQPICQIESLQRLINMIDEKLSTLNLSLLNDLEDAEPIYWQNQLGRQCALEIVTYGRVRPETMNLLMCLEEDSFIATMSIAGRLSHKIQITGELGMNISAPLPDAVPVVS
jgi:hypothetical protein